MITIPFWAYNHKEPLGSVWLLNHNAQGLYGQGGPDPRSPTRMHLLNMRLGAVSTKNLRVKHLVVGAKRQSTPTLMGNNKSYAGSFFSYNSPPTSQEIFRVSMGWASTAYINFVLGKTSSVYGLGIYSLY
jgi:hypothetical protein